MSLRFDRLWLVRSTDRALDPIRKIVAAVSLSAVLAASVSLLIPLAAGGLPAYAEAALAADPGNPDQVKRGAVVYGQFCAACHGFRLQGQPNWRGRLPDGRMPAPPHDESGHTWHHPDDMLFAMTKQGMVPFAPASYESNMPAFGPSLSDQEIWDVLAFIKSYWPDPLQKRHNELNRAYRKQQQQ